MFHKPFSTANCHQERDQYSKTISRIRIKTSFALLRSALVCLRGSKIRRMPSDIKNVDIDFEVVEGAIQSDY